MNNGGLRYQFARLNIAEKLIAVNVLVFLVGNLIPVLFGSTSNAIVQWFELPEDFMAFLSKINSQPFRIGSNESDKSSPFEVRLFLCVSFK